MEHTVNDPSLRRECGGILVDPGGNAVRLSALTFAALWAMACTAHAEDPQALLQKYNCTICHAADEAKTGPAFADVAESYRDDPHAVSKIAGMIRKGVHGGGPWPMPPSPQVSAAEATAIAQYIVALRK
jgi:cytochrome c